LSPIMIGEQLITEQKIDILDNTAAKPRCTYTSPCLLCAEEYTDDPSPH